MPYRRELLIRVLMMTGETGEDEIGCEECWEEIDRFAEMVILNHSPEEDLPLVDAHLRNCRECADEFRALLDALWLTTPRHAICSRT